MKPEIDWGLYARSLADFVLIECRLGRSEAEADAHQQFELMKQAGQVLVFNGGALISIEEIFNELCACRFIQNRQVFEAWEYQVAQRVIAHSKTLNPIQMRALLAFTGYSEGSLSVLEMEARLAVRDASLELCGESA